MSRAHSFNKGADLYFATMTIVGWLDVFTRDDYRQILYDSWNYCWKQKGLRIHAYVIMTNHVHWIVSTEGEKLSAIMRDMKKFTSKRLFEAIANNPKESRREWMKSQFEFSGRTCPQNKDIKIWQSNDKPIALWSPDVIKQKLDYIHLNPVKAGFVDSPDQFRHSSAVQYAGGRALFEVIPLD
jgi:putative transposase